MKKGNVIAPKNLPGRLPVGLTLVSILSLDYWNAPEWLMGVVGFVLGILWISSIWSLSTETRVDLFEEDKTESPNQKNSFKERLKEAERKAADRT